MFAARSPFAAPLLLAMLGSGCGLSAIDDAFIIETPSTDGPFEIDTQVEEGLDPSLVRAGLFDVNVPGEDEAGDDVDALIDILVSRDGKAKLEDAPEGIETVIFEPIELVEPGPDGQLVVALPEAEHDEQLLTLVVWYDADGDGALTLSSIEGASEFARAPSRVFPESDGRTMALYSIWPVRSDEREYHEGTHRAQAATEEVDDEGVRFYTDNWIANRELSGWTVELSNDSM